MAKKRKKRTRRRKAATSLLKLGIMFGLVSAALPNTAVELKRLNVPAALNNLTVEAPKVLEPAKAKAIATGVVGLLILGAARKMIGRGNNPSITLGNRRISLF